MAEFNAIAPQQARGFPLRDLAYSPRGKWPTMPNPNSYYECKDCGAKFDSKEQLDGHNRREHSSGVKAGAGSGMGSGNRGGTNPTQKKNM